MNYIQNIKVIEFDGTQTSALKYEMVMGFTLRINLDKLADAKDISGFELRLFKLGVGQTVVKQKVEEMVDQQIGEAINKTEITIKLLKQTVPTELTWLPQVKKIDKNNVCSSFLNFKTFSETANNLSEKAINFKVS